MYSSAEQLLMHLPWQLVLYIYFLARIVFCGGQWRRIFEIFLFGTVILCILAQYCGWPTDVRDLLNKYVTVSSTGKFMLGGSVMNECECQLYRNTKTYSQLFGLRGVKMAIHLPQKTDGWVDWAWPMKKNFFFFFVVAANERVISLWYQCEDCMELHSQDQGPLCLSTNRNSRTALLGIFIISLDLCVV